MKPRRTHESNGVFRLDGGTEDNDLHVEHAADASGNPVIASVWELDEHERKAIANGSNIELVIWGKGHPPVAMHLTTVELGKRPDDTETAIERQNQDAADAADSEAAQQAHDERLDDDLQS